MALLILLRLCLQCTFGYTLAPGFNFLLFQHARVRVCVCLCVWLFFFLWCYPPILSPFLSLVPCACLLAFWCMLTSAYLMTSRHCTKGIRRAITICRCQQLQIIWMFASTGTSRCKRLSSSPATRILSTLHILPRELSCLVLQVEAVHMSHAWHANTVWCNHTRQQTAYS